MGRGLGPVQRRILELLETTPPKAGPGWLYNSYAGRPEAGWSIAELAAALDLSQRRTRAAVTALDERGLVFQTVGGVSVKDNYLYGNPAYGHVVWTMEQAQRWHGDKIAERNRQRADEARRNAEWAAMTPEERERRRAESRARIAEVIRTDAALGGRGYE